MADAPDLIFRAANRLAKTEAPMAPPADDRVSYRPKPSNGNGALVQPLNTAPTPAPHAAVPAKPYARSVVLSQATLAANGIMLPTAGFSRQTEEFRSIKRQVLSGILKNGSPTAPHLNRIMMVTSAAPSEGKTHVSINLALAVAVERDFSVVLVDADAHRQSLVTRLGISPEKGWLDVLTNDSVGLSDVLLGTNIPNLAILPAGNTRAEVPELMSSRKMADMVAQLVNENPNRLVIFDCLPCLVSTEPTILASLVGQALFVVAAGETSREEIESSLRLLDGCPSINLILNKGDPLLIDQFSRYGYGYGYHAKE
jgi:exopolysaccharide/PEP-CTERM locus tyrosine autokinase